MRARSFLAIAVALVVAVLVAARRHRPDDQPYTPRDEAEVLEEVTAGVEAERLRLERRLAQAPEDLEAALALAGLELDEARRGDAGRLVYAEAVLRPWSDAPSPPPRVQALRAAIAEARAKLPARPGGPP